MRIEQLSRQKSKQWKQLLTDYLDANSSLDGLYGRAPRLENFKAQFEEKAQTYSHRQVLIEHLRSQYAGLELSSAPDALIDKLDSDNSFTVTTGHQLCLFGGPAYFIYKIAGTISLAQKLKAAYPDKNFISVFWLASEDHDFEEIDHLRLFSKTIRWERESGGAVGRRGMKGIAAVGEELKEIFGQSNFADELNAIFERSYLNATNLAEATIKLVHELFTDQVLCLDADSRSTKALFKEIMKDELLNESAASVTTSSNRILEESGNDLQIHIRDINLFYLAENSRERIVRENNNWKTNDGAQHWDETSLLKELEEAPERFSPNVALRPLYQEVILPNIAYVGGGGEMAYWLQLKPIFDHYNCPFPILMPRLSVTAVIPSVAKKLEKLNVSADQCFQRSEDLIKRFLEAQVEIADFDDERELIKKAAENALSKMEDLDEGFRKSVSAEFRNMAKTLDKVYGKYRKQVKSREEISLNQLKSVQDSIFPNEKHQERVENFALWYLRTGKEAINRMIDEMDPFQFNMLLLYP